MHPSFKSLFLLIAAIVLLGGAWLFWYSRGVEPAPEVYKEIALDENTEDINGVLVTQAGAAITGSQLPPGFPSDIPVEQTNVTESYRAVYTENRATQYTVSFTSNKSRDALWDEYSAYMKSADYVVETGATSKSQGQIIGVRDNDTLSVIVSTRSGLSLVQISLLDRDQ